MQSSANTMTTRQVFKYDSEKPAFARKGALMATSSPAISLTDQYPEIVEYLASLETAERIKFYPHLTERAPNIEIDVEQLSNDTSATNNSEEENKDNRDTSTIASLRHEGIKDFSLQLLTNIEPSTYINITTLDVSHNELSDLPGIASLCNLEALCIKRNWFNTLPTDIGKLHKLKKIDASRNFMKPNIDSLRLNELKNLSQLQVLDVTLNQKCRTADHRKYIKQYLHPLDVEVLVTVWQEASNGEHNCIGASAAQRNAILLRSQLEPWGTVNLRRRLVMDFNQDPADQLVDENGTKKLVDRGTIMEMLLSCYQKEGLLQFDNDSDSEDLNMGIGQRKVIRVDGVPVRQELLNEILEELKDWRHNGKRGGSSNNRERPSIKAECYMILRAPPLEEETTSEAKGTYASRREKRRHKKMEGNKKLWNLALQAIKETDPDFATRCSEIAVTYGFTGSPHIDRQNSSPFYGLSLGNFTECTGCVAVECSARIMAHVNTKNRLGRVDGRHPHFVTPYDDQNEERFSLIYYDTLGAFEAPGPAIFTKSLDS